MAENTSDNIRGKYFVNKNLLFTKEVLETIKGLCFVADQTKTFIFIKKSLKQL